MNVNVTLIFSIDRHDLVIEAYLKGLERLAETGGDLSKIASVASFFVSRVDTETDRRLPEGSPLRGKAAVANAAPGLPAVPAALLRPALGGAGGAGRAPAAAAVGVDVDQEPRLPVHALRRRADRPRHGEHACAGVDRGVAGAARATSGRTPSSSDVAGAHQVMKDLAAAGVDFDDVTATLEREGVDSFSGSFHDAFNTIEKRRAEVTG